MKRRLAIVAIVLIIVTSVIGATTRSSSSKSLYPSSMPNIKPEDVPGKIYSIGEPGKVLSVGTYYFGDGAKVIIGHIEQSEILE